MRSLESRRTSPSVGIYTHLVSKQSHSYVSANGGTTLHSPIYHLLATDLRKSPAESLAPLLASSTDTLLSPSLPTLLLFECVLVYMSPEASRTILQWFTDYFAAGSGVLGCIVYEMFALEDSFGKVMVSNLKVSLLVLFPAGHVRIYLNQARNVSLPGAKPYPTFDSLPNRFLQHGCEIAQALTLKDIRREYIDPRELERWVSLS